MYFNLKFKFGVLLICRQGGVFIGKIYTYISVTFVTLLLNNKYEYVVISFCLNSDLFSILTDLSNALNNPKLSNVSKTR